MINFFTKEVTSLFLIICCSSSVFGQNTKTYQLDEIEVSARREKCTLDETFKSTFVITKEEIALLPVQNLEDVLEYISGVDIRQRGMYGIQSDVSIRGGSFEQALILLNGVKLSDPQTGHHNMNLPIPIYQIERIEVLKGAGARIYGQNAFAGAINIITKTLDEKKIVYSRAIGENQYCKEGILASYPFKQYQQNISYNTSRSSGYKMNTDFRIHQLFYQSTWREKMNLNIGYLDKSFGANGFYTNLFPWQWEHTKTSFINLGWEGGKKIRFESNIYYRNNSDEFLLKRDTPLFYMNEHTTNIYGTDFKSEFLSKFGKTSFGGDYRYEKIESSNLGNHERINVGLFLEHKFVFKKLVLSPGVYLNWNKSNKFSFFPGIDVVYMPSDFTKLYATIGKTYRTPSFTELFYNSPANIGDTKLKAEESTSFELGYRFKKDKFSLSIAGFRRQAVNLIDWVRKSDTLAWQVVNITKVNTTGYEAELKLFPKMLFYKKCFVKEVSIYYTYLHADQLENKVLSKNILDYLNHQLIVSISCDISSKFQQIWKVRFEDRFGYDAHTLIDMRLAYNYNKARIYIEASNLFSITYYEFGGLEMPDRWVRIGAEVNIGLK